MNTSKSLHLVGFLVALIAGLFLFGACKDVKKEAGKKAFSPMQSWLEKLDNYQQENYRDTFLTAFNDHIANNNIKLASNLIVSYGNTVSQLFVYDTFFVSQATDFLEKFQGQLDAESEVGLNYVIGTSYSTSDDLVQSDKYLQEAVSVKTDDADAIQYKGFAGIVISENYRRKGLLSEALEQSLENLELFASIDDKTNQATSLIAIGDIYARMKLYVESNNSNREAAEIAKSVNDTLNILVAYINLSKPNPHKNKFDGLEHYSKKAISLYEKWSETSPYFAGHIYLNYSGICLMRNKLDSVQFFIDKAVEESNNHPSLQLRIIAKNLNLDALLKRPVRNPGLVQEAYEFVKSKNEHVLILAFAGGLSDAAYNKGNYKEAYDYLQEKYSVRDSSWNVQTRAELSSMEKKFQLEEKKKLIAEQDASLARSRFQISALVFTLIGLGLGILVFLGFRKRMEAIDSVKRQQKFTDELLHKIEIERERIGADLHDSVNNELMSLKIDTDKNFERVNQKIDSIMESVRTISRNLHPVMFDKIGLQITIEQMIEQLQIQNDFVISSEINYENGLSTPKELQLYRILQEATNNMIKYSKAIAGKITIRENTSEVLVEIKDNGIGFDVEEKLNSSDSFGLHNIIERSRTIGGKAVISSDKNGTIINISIPKSQQ